MCRNIRTLHNSNWPASQSEIEAAALQYVRKISGFTKPSQANQAAFDEAVAAVAHASAHLLEQLTTVGAAEGPGGRGRQGARPRRGALRPPERTCTGAPARPRRARSPLVPAAQAPR